jgi:hypothetical protein
LIGFDNCTMCAIEICAAVNAKLKCHRRLPIKKFKNLQCKSLKARHLPHSNLISRNLYPVCILSRSESLYLPTTACPAFQPSAPCGPDCALWARTQESTSDSLNFQRRPMRWAGRPLRSIHRYMVSRPTPKCSVTSSTEDQRSIGSNMSDSVGINRIF